MPPASASTPTPSGAGRRILCAHADLNGAGMHWLAPGETCHLLEQRPADD